MNKISYLILALWLSATSFSISLSPNILEVKLKDKEAYSEIRVRNDSDLQKRYSISLIKPDDIGDPSYYLGDNIQFYPPLLNLKPGESKTIKLLIDNYSHLDKGEYRAYLSIKEILPPNAKGVSVTLNVNSSIYGIKGEISKGFSIEDYSISGTAVSGRIYNTGNSSLKLKVQYKFSDGSSLFTEHFIGREGTQDISKVFSIPVVGVDVFDRNTGRLIKSL